MRALRSDWLRIFHLLVSLAFFLFCFVFVLRMFCVPAEEESFGQQREAYLELLIVYRVSSSLACFFFFFFYESSSSRDIYSGVSFSFGGLFVCRIGR